MKPLFDVVFRAATLPFRARRRDMPAEDTPQGRPHRRRVIIAIGSVALVAGLALLAYGGNQMLAQEPQAGPGDGVPVFSAIDADSAIYDRPLPATLTPTPAPSPPPPAAPPQAPLRDSPYRIRMPKIGIDAQVVTYGLDANGVPEVPYNGWEVAWYDWSARPGTGSNAVFAGHVTWSGRAVFWDLDDMAPGDDIMLEATDGTKVMYKVSEVFLVDANDPNALRVMDPTPSDTMTVITCGGDYFYVGGVAQYDYTHRLIVRAALTGIQAPGG